MSVEFMYTLCTNKPTSPKLAISPIASLFVGHLHLHKLIVWNSEFLERGYLDFTYLLRCTPKKCTSRKPTGSVPRQTPCQYPNYNIVGVLLSQCTGSDTPPAAINASPT